jgi:hypothetical protein
MPPFIAMFSFVLFTTYDDFPLYNKTVHSKLTSVFLHLLANLHQQTYDIPWKSSYFILDSYYAVNRMITAFCIANVNVV